MTIRLNLSQALKAFLLLSIIYLQGCSTIVSMGTAEPIESDPGSRTTGRFIDDEIVETKAAVNLDKVSPELAQAHISITSYNGIVLLVGQVPSEELRQLAANTVAKIPKITRIHNELTVSGTSSILVRSNDGWISTKLKSKMLAQSDIPGSRIKVVTENGVVYLMGLLTKEEAGRAIEVARTTAGVQKVVSIFEYIDSEPD
jgi:osmotically-inducible protein OsmY